MLKFLARMFVNTSIFSTFCFLFVYWFVVRMCFRLLKHISDDATWISELEMFHFMSSMYLSSWWWVHGCMDELQRVTWCHEACGV